MYKIKGVIKEYAWGGYSFLSSLLDLPPAPDRPRAEYWLGTHPAGSATIAELKGTNLADVLETQDLPFLFKVLDVRDMLSIQVHPNLEQARAGFAREDAEVKVDDPTRVYRDRNHKPELMVALSEFYLVQGFLSEDDLAARMIGIAEFESLLPILSSGGIKGLFSYWMSCSQNDVNAILKPLGKRIKPLYESGDLVKEDINFWAARAFLTFNRPGRCDRGILALYMMNLLKLAKGDGIFQRPGVLHAYLEGQNVECMATSDNVVRGGLTQKHMDIEELLKVTNVQPSTPEVITAKTDTESGLETYAIPKGFNSFSFTKIVGSQNFILSSDHAGIIFCLSGDLTISRDARSLHLGKGEAAYIDRQQSTKLVASDQCTAFLCS